MKSNYIIQETEKTFCKYCGKPVHLLCHWTVRTNVPAFYVCFPCKKIFQVGHGEVGKE